MTLQESLAVLKFWFSRTAKPKVRTPSEPDRVPDTTRKVDAVLSNAVAGQEPPVAPAIRREDGTLLPANFTMAHVFSPDERATALSLLEEKGARLLPYPFASAIGVVSDIDGSDRRRSDGYMGMLVDTFGFDFGDSTWLRWPYNKNSGTGHGSGFFTPTLSEGSSLEGKIYRLTRTFIEMVAEYHKGNVDHFHSLLSTGPRAMVIEDFEENASGGLEADLSPMLDDAVGKCKDSHVFGVCIVSVPGKSLDVTDVSVWEDTGIVTTGYRQTPYDGAESGREYRLFIIDFAPDQDGHIPFMERLGRVVIQFGAKGKVSDVERLILLNSYGGIFLDRIKRLQDSFNVEINLVTDHAGFHFRTPFRSERNDPMLKERVFTLRQMSSAYNGRLLDNDGQLIFSTDSDEPYSFARVLPELSQDFEVRFIVPHAATLRVGCDAFDLVTPTSTRSGGGVYWAKRVLPETHIPGPLGPSRGDTFASRVAWVLGKSSLLPGQFWPIYTHLGKTLSSKEIPSPYFEVKPMRALQDRVFNISGDVEPSQRFWFARATVLYDYALMLRGVAPRVERPDADTVAISSWFDPVLGKRLPRSTGQLYGLTFYVRDCAKATVRLDGQEIQTIFRNPPDQTGRPSITIAASDLRAVVFDRVDPSGRASDMSLSDGEWRWTRESASSRAFGRLTTSGAVASLKVLLQGWNAPGSQALSFALRKSENARFGLLLETQSGGRFFLGDADMDARLNLAAPPTARYAIDPSWLGASGEWRTIAVPFHDLEWAAKSEPGGPFPSHPVQAMTIFCEGPEGASVDIAQMVFLRPRTSAGSTNTERGYCVVGHVPGFKPGQTVEALRDDGSGAILATRVDQMGYFCFPGVEDGVYRIWSASSVGDLHDRRGDLVDVQANIPNLVLDRIARPRDARADDKATVI